MSSTVSAAQLFDSVDSSRVCGWRNKKRCYRQSANQHCPREAWQTEQDLLRAERIENPHWEGKQLQVAVGQAIEKEQQMAVPFAVLNSSARTIEVLPPQVQLAGTSKDKHRKAIKAEPVAIKTTGLTSRRLAPGARADGIVVFDRPTFKESGNALARGCPRRRGRRPVLAPIAFVAPVSGGAK